MAHNCLNGLYSSVASLAPRVDLFDPCDFLEKCLLSFSQIFSASLHSEISEIGDWETRPSCHFWVHMSTTVITNYHALVPPKKCPGAYSTRWSLPILVHLVSVCHLTVNPYISSLLQDINLHRSCRKCQTGPNCLKKITT